MNRQPFLLLVGIVIFLGGCTLAPKYTQPKAPIPSQWPQGAAYKDTKAMAGAPTVPALKWEDFLPTNGFKRLL
jgi:hypothetical protein